MEFGFTLIKLITLLGLALDVMGAWYISRGLMRKSKEDIVKETGFSWGPNDNYIIGGLVQKIECNVGFYLLLAGFSLQGLSTILSGNLMNILLMSNNVLIIVGGEVIGVYVIYKCLEWTIRINSKRMILVHVKSVVREHIDASESPMNPMDARRHLRYLGLDLAEEIPEEAVWGKLLDAIK